ncbi:hypothetical protein [Chryseobacterium koreense]|uniref:hypothetical protein n=1 Tax=Chryseobacterium koreense TaxID=232216 RepID=UPI0026EDDF42|nr:hypothetical protein [Chryseobacterium koreense]
MYYKDKIIKDINPNNKSYKSWIYVARDTEFPDDNEIVYKYGNYEFENANNITEGIFYECAPDYNCYRIFKVWNEKKAFEITNKENFINFLGKIDNLQEALLLIRLDNYWFDRNFEIGGAYKITKDFVYIYGTNSDDYHMKFYKLKINRSTKKIQILKEGKIEGKKFPNTIS